MSSFEKVVKLATKPKAAPPKAKYIDPIIAATWSDDGAVHDVCKALVSRLREPNTIVVFKALIVLHTMMRNGATDNVLSYLSSSDVLKLRHVSSGNWEGYTAPENLQNYALYLDSRIRAYRDLKHDAIRVQAETNRDMRNSVSGDPESHRGRKQQATKASASAGPTRSKTIMGRKLRVMTVEKGLLRETKAVHRMIDALVECRFYLDDLEDELTITALRMLVMDLLILFQAGNEGVINVLEHYFEMSHVDAKEALLLYRHFCAQTELVVEYLSIAKKLQNLLNVPIPNLKHAPVSLAGALQEYLDDPNFEQNRIEYKASKEASEHPSQKNGAGSSSKASTPTNSKAIGQSTPSNLAAKSNGSSSTTGLKENKDIIDFFSAIEEEQPTLFNNSPSSPYFQQQGAPNPFAQMANGNAFIHQVPQVAPQPTGFLAPQQTAFQQAPNPFTMMIQQQSQLQPQPTEHRPFSSYLQPQQTQPQQMQIQPQQTGFLQPQHTNFLQPQPTGSNPFRQSMLIPQSTGMALFAPSSVGNGVGQNFKQSMPANQQGGPNFSGAFSATGSSFTNPPSPFASAQANVPARPASTPLTSFGQNSNAASPPTVQPVKTHQTGTKNPFGPISTAPPPVPKAPTMMELAMGWGTNNGQQQQQQQPMQQQPTGFAFSSSALSPGATDISSVASSFSFAKKTGDGSQSQGTTPSFMQSKDLPQQNTSTTTTGSTFSDSFFSSLSLSTQPTGVTNAPSSPSVQVSPPIKPQITGFSGLKPFKPSSSFGASLMESLPPIPGSAPGTPAIAGAAPAGGADLAQTSNQGFGLGMNGMGTQSTGFGSMTSQPTGSTGGFKPTSTLGQGLRPQMTGGAANPFRASMMGLSSAPPMPAFNGSSMSSSSLGFSGTGASPFGVNSGAFGSNLRPNNGQ